MHNSFPIAMNVLWLYIDGVTSMLINKDEGVSNDCLLQYKMLREFQKLGNWTNHDVHARRWAKNNRNCHDACHTAQWRSQRGANEITLCTEVYGEPSFWVPVSPPAHPWAPLPPPHFEKSGYAPDTTGYWRRWSPHLYTETIWLIE